MTEIEAFLSTGSNFEQGIELLRKYQPDSPQLLVLGIGESSFTWNILTTALNSIKIQPETKVKKAKYSEDVKASWPDRIKEKYNSAIELMRRRSETHALLKLTIYGATKVRKYDQRKTGKMAELIIDLNEAIDLLFYQIDYFVEQGKDAPGTALMSHDERMLYWLKNQVNYTMYCRNKESGKQIEVNDLYTYRKAVLAEINTYLCRATEKKH